MNLFSDRTGVADRHSFHRAAGVQFRVNAPRGGPALRQAANLGRSLRCGGDEIVRLAGLRSSRSRPVADRVRTRFYPRA